MGIFVVMGVKLVSVKKKDEKQNKKACRFPLPQTIYFYIWY